MMEVLKDIGIVIKSLFECFLFMFGILILMWLWAATIIGIHRIGIKRRKKKFFETDDESVLGDYDDMDMDIQDKLNEPDRIKRIERDKKLNSLIK